MLTGRKTKFVSLLPEDLTRTPLDEAEELKNELKKLQSEFKDLQNKEKDQFGFAFLKNKLDQIQKGIEYNAIKDIKEIEDKRGRVLQWSTDIENEKKLIEQIHSSESYEINLHKTIENGKYELDKLFQLLNIQLQKSEKNQNNDNIHLLCLKCCGIATETDKFISRIFSHFESPIPTRNPIINLARSVVGLANAYVFISPLPVREELILLNTNLKNILKTLETARKLIEDYVVNLDSQLDKEKHFLLIGFCKYKFDEFKNTKSGKQKMGASSSRLFKDDEVKSSDDPSPRSQAKLTS